jgi:ATP-dependent phosphoenolpyruvate carboxykinase
MCRSLPVIAAPEFEAVPERDGTASSAFILADFTRKIILIGGTKYAGEMKKSIFGVMNFHCAAAGRAAHALLGECGRGWGDGALLRAFGHGQDDALGGPGAAADRRRRARLEPDRGLQF